MNLKQDSSEVTKSTTFSIKAYSTNLQNLNLVIDQIKEEHKSRVGIYRLRPKIVKHTILKNPHGKGYSVYVTMKLKIRRVLITGNNFRVYRSCRSTLKTLGIYTVNKINY